MRRGRHRRRDHHRGRLLSSVLVTGRAVEFAEIPGDPQLAPIVLLHEGLGSVGLWRDFPQTLSRATGRRVIAYSRFGHGRSVPPPRPRTPSFFHEEALVVLPHLLDAVNAPGRLLVGHSDGASIALIHAARHPVEGVVLLAPHVFVEEQTLTAISDTRERFGDGDLRERMRQHHDDPDAAFWGWCDVWLDPTFRGWTLDAEAAALTAPTLLIQGSEDPYGTLEQLERIQTRARGPVDRLVLAGGHSPHVEHPAEVAGAIAAFSRTLTSARGE
jgi:pimeloyl-ACP methyl ester carboxylesterase